MLGSHMFIMFIYSWWILPLRIMKWPCLSLFMVFVLKSSLSDMSIATLPLFSSPCTWNIFFQPFTFNLRRFFVLRWVSCRQHMCRLYFLIHSAIPCLLSGALVYLHLRMLLIGNYSLPFSPFVPTFLSHFFFFPFLKVVPLVSLAELVWRRCSLWGFFHLGLSLFGLPF